MTVHDPSWRRCDSRHAILLSAADLVDRRDLHDVKIDDIVEASGYSRQTFYNHYRTKADLMAGVVHAFLESLAGCVAGIRSDACAQGLAEALCARLDADRDRAFARVALGAMDLPAVRRRTGEARKRCGGAIATRLGGPAADPGGPSLVLHLLKERLWALDRPARPRAGGGGRGCKCRMIVPPRRQPPPRM